MKFATKQQHVMPRENWDLFISVKQSQQKQKNVSLVVSENVRTAMLVYP